jgi:hypothetical protein
MLPTSSKSSRILNYYKDSRKTDLNELWSDGLIEIIITNPSKLHFGQEVLHGELQRLELQWCRGGYQEHHRCGDGRPDRG